MGKRVDRMIRKVQQSSGVDKGSAIAILKSQNLIRQSKRGNGLALTDKARKRG